MNYLSLFSGAGGFEWFAKLMGWRCVGYVEKDDFCKQVLRARIRDGIFDDAPIFSDVRTFDGGPYRDRVDIITAGFPCQPFSLAGRKRGEDDERNCWPDTFRILREVQPRMALLENVPGLLGSHGYFGTILGQLAESGFDARWCCLSAANAGAPHIRDRLWMLVTDTDGNHVRDRERRHQETLGTQTELRHDGEDGTMADTPLLGRDDSSITRPGKDSSLAGAARARHGQPSRGRGGAIGEPSWWLSEPDVGRVADGVAHRSDRLRALGNGIVPAVAREAWRRLTA